MQPATPAVNPARVAPCAPRCHVQLASTPCAYSSSTHRNQASPLLVRVERARIGLHKADPRTVFHEAGVHDVSCTVRTMVNGWGEEKWRWAPVGVSGEDTHRL
jgi:hypothetical protein